MFGGLWRRGRRGDEEREETPDDLQKAAEAGDQAAMHNLGLLLQETDSDAARMWLERAAEQGNGREQSRVTSAPKSALLSPKSDAKRDLAPLRELPFHP